MRNSIRKWRRGRKRAFDVLHYASVAVTRCIERTSVEGGTKPVGSGRNNEVAVVDWDEREKDEFIGRVHMDGRETLVEWGAVRVVGPRRW